MSTNNDFLSELNKQFGDEEAMGVRFKRVDSDIFPDEVVFTPIEYDVFMKNNPSHDDDYLSFFLRSGLDAVCCTNSAIEVMISYPEQTIIYGFANEENPEARIVKDELHPGGHDFAIVNDQYLVDPWIKFVAGACDQIVFDLHDEHDKRHVLEWYGAKENWQTMTAAMKEAVSIASNINDDSLLVPC